MEFDGSVGLNSSDEQETLPDTQPVDSESDSVESWSSGGQTIWGHLIPANIFMPSVALVKPKFVCGRQPLAEDDDETQILALEGRSQIPSKFLSLVSRRHMSIEKDSDGDVFIVDLSSNGTFVNSVLLGRGQKRPLVNNDSISFASPVLGGFKFVQAPDMKGPVDFPDDIKQKYLIGKILGSGIAGWVFTAFAKAADYQKVALKVIRKSSASETLSNEVNILCKLNHPNIIRLLEYFEDNHYCVIVMELAHGGELFDYVLQDFHNRSFDENVAKLQFFQILKGVIYMHDRKVCHRDLKLENILLAQKGRDSLIKIADFGLSKVIGLGTQMKSFVGTSNYIAPEVLKNGIAGDTTSYDLSADMWSLGCILYSLLCGSPAFYQGNDQDLNSKILSGRYNMNHPGLANVSSEAKDLITKLLNVDPKERLSARAASVHPWLRDQNVIKRSKELAFTGHPTGVRQISHGVRNMTIMSPQLNQRRKRPSYVVEGEDDGDIKNMAPPAKRDLR